MNNCVLTNKAAFILLAFFTFFSESQAFSFSEAEEAEQAEYTRKPAARISQSCLNRLKQKKTAVIIGEKHSNGWVKPIRAQNYGSHFQIINQKIRSLGIQTYTPEEITKQIAEEEIAATLNNDPDAAVSASQRLGANFIIRGVISSRSQINPIVQAHEVFVNMSFTLSDSTGRTLGNSMAGDDSWSGADTMSVSLSIVREQADRVVKNLFRSYCK